MIHRDNSQITLLLYANYFALVTNWLSAIYVSTYFAYLPNFYCTNHNDGLFEIKPALAFP